LPHELEEGYKIFHCGKVNNLLLFMLFNICSTIGVFKTVARLAGGYIESNSSLKMLVPPDISSLASLVKLVLPDETDEALAIL
jgi:hypothetical protein